MSAYRPTFVSHAHADNDQCDRYVTALRARGIDTWYDRNDTQAGHFLGTDIQRELEQRTSFVLLMTQQALDSFWVQLELQAYMGLMAQDRSRMLLPVRIGPCQVPPFLNALFWVDAQSMSVDQAIDTLATTLTVPEVVSAQIPDTASPPPRDTLPPLGPAPTPAGAIPAPHLTTTALYNLGFRGYSVEGVECVLPPLRPVLGGSFTMGSDKAHDKEGQDNETPQCFVQVGDFALGQHPVTVAEYACALGAKAEGVGKPGGIAFWSRPILGGKAAPWQEQLKRLDHPVVCVSWQDAHNYKVWLRRVTAQPWRLLTEAEWEKAARGTDGRIYPWGDAFDKAKCNTFASGLNSTTAVGTYPSGASPYEVLDMAGNVWEMTVTALKPCPYGQNENLKSMGTVLRGSSWASNADLARVACRGRMTGVEVNGDIGFRLAWSAAAGS